MPVLKMPGLKTPILQTPILQTPILKTGEMIAEQAATAGPNDRAMRRYVVLWAIWVVVLLIGVAGFCAAVDPYLVLGTPAIVGLTADKPAAVDWPRLAKVYAVERAHPRTLLLGSSTVDVGFDPSSPLWDAAARPVFNLGIDGGTPYLDLRFLQHAAANGQPTRLLLGVSFPDSLLFAPERAGTAASGEQFDYERRLSVLADYSPNPEAGRAHFRDLLFATLSLDAVHDSIATLLRQHDSFTAYETALGWNTGGESRRWASQDGYGELFANKEGYKFRQLLRWRTAKRLDVDRVAQIVRFARAHGMAATIVILPNHVDLIEAIAQLGLQDDLARWKAEMVRGVAEAGGGSATPVWDFSGLSPYTTEPVPALGDKRTHLRWFFEPIHFQPALGALMLARMQGSAAPAGFGQLLSPGAVADEDRAQRVALAEWEARNPAAVGRIKAQIDRVR